MFNFIWDVDDKEYEKWAKDAGYNEEKKPTAFGKCGDNVYWMLIDKVPAYFTLEVWGEGAIWDVEYGKNRWVEFANYGVDIDGKSCNLYPQDIYIHEGITSIGENAFSEIYGSPRVWLPASLTEIKEFAFGMTEVLFMEIPSTVKRVEDGIINSNECNVGLIVISGAIEEVSPYAIGCKWGNICDVYFTDSPAPNAFQDWITFTVEKLVRKNGTRIHYPESWKEMVKDAAYPWESYPDGTKPWLEVEYIKKNRD